MKTVLCFGDSNTYGFNPATKERFDWGVYWTSIIADRLRDYDINIVNEGLCGRTAAHDDPVKPYRNGFDSLPMILETHNPIDTIILMLGTNDCKTQFKTDEHIVGWCIKRLIEVIKLTCPDTKILLVSPIELGRRVWAEEFDPKFSKNSIEITKRLPEVYENISKIYEIDFLAASDYADPSETDREHMDEEGHLALADAIYEKLKEMNVY
ncbi:MAG: arylesterase [Firmicutes bacterium]|nr:arylesterase [Bacillota bacterium]